MPDFDAAYREHAPRVRRYLARRCSTPDQIDDATQETFLRAWQIWERAAGIENIGRWLIGIARRVFGHMLRAAGVVTQRNEVAARGGDREHVSLDALPEAALPAQPPQQEMAVYVEQLRRHFRGLPEAQRDVMLGIADGELANEIAARRGTSQQAAQEMVRRVRSRLRMTLGDDLLLRA